MSESACANIGVAILFSAITDAVIKQQATLLHVVSGVVFILRWIGHADQRGKKCNFLIDVLDENRWSPLGSDEGEAIRQ